MTPEPINFDTFIRATKDFGFIKKGTLIRAKITNQHFNGLVVLIENSDMPVLCTINPSPILIVNGKLRSDSFSF